jgi:hypothetical protein
MGCGGNVGRGSVSSPPARDASLPIAVQHDVSTLLRESCLEGADDALAHVADVLECIDCGESCGPSSVLLHGPSSSELEAVVHLVGVRLGVPVVQLFGSRALPQRWGGSQPLIASALNRVRDRRGSVVWLDELHSLAVPSHRALRAFHDLVNESVRPSFAPAVIVIGTYVDRCSTSPPPAYMTGRFCRSWCVRLPLLAAPTTH